MDFSAALLSFWHVLNPSAGRGHDRGRPNRADRANGVHVHPTSDGCVPSTIPLLHGARVSSDPLVCCCNRAFQPRGPARGLREPASAGNCPLRKPLALPPRTRPQPSLLRRRIGPGLFSIDA